MDCGYFNYEKLDSFLKDKKKISNKMSNGYFNYEKLDSFLKDKKEINDKIRIVNEDQKKFKLKTLDNINKEKINKEYKIDIKENDNFINYKINKISQIPKALNNNGNIYQSNAIKNKIETTKLNSENNKNHINQIDELKKALLEEKENNNK